MIIQVVLTFLVDIDGVSEKFESTLAECIKAGNIYLKETLEKAEEKSASFEL